MGRFWLGICLLAAFLVLGLWVTYSMDTLHQPISQTLEAPLQSGASYFFRNEVTPSVVHLGFCSQCCA